MKRFLTFIFFGIMLTLSAQAQKPLCIDSIFLEYYPKEHFEPIGTFFGYTEQSRDTVIRTDCKCLNGPYWVIRFNQAVKNLPCDTVIELKYQDSKNNGIQTRTFTLGDYYRGPSSYLWLGLTGEDCCNPVTQILAWKIDIKTPCGSCQSHSFLWKLP